MNYHQPEGFCCTRSEFETEVRHFVLALEKSECTHSRQKPSSSLLLLLDCWAIAQDAGQLWLRHHVVVTNTVLKRTTQNCSTQSHGVETSQSHDVPPKNDDFVDLTLWQDPDIKTASDETNIENVLSLEWRLSCVYSETWRVPVLYFDVQDSNGNPCSRDLILKVIGYHDDCSEVGSVHDLDSASWEFISAEEHPITGTPSFFLHPCRTPARLQTLLLSTTTSMPPPPGVLICSWLSLMVPALKLFHICPRTFQRVQELLVQEKERRQTTDNDSN